ncbi:MAG: 2-oxoglutarate dehydrogenase complex dihydrolipoyllysine-residue succinyltransferase [Planctomycetes bacterium]|nr:2-oxoglutarate dehydrogenase complex dihydrolipoyllysine-residue succinyltransferase [Planctomycetota bacterium]
MAIELKVPSVGESIKEVIIGTWMKQVGDAVETDEPVVEIDSDKASQELGAPSGGTIQKLLKEEGETAKVGEVIAIIDENGKPSAKKSGGNGEAAKKTEPAKKPEAPKKAKGESRIMPAALRLMEENKLKVSDVQGTGPGGRILKEDVQRALEVSSRKPAVADADLTALDAPKQGGMRETETVRMSNLRKRLAQRLVDVQQTAAILTTFNEVDMSAVMALRAEHKDAFLKKYEVKLGFMSFFVKATVDALRMMPQVNAKIEGDNIVYHNYQDIGVAVGGGRGLVVPVLRNAERLSFAEIEQAIADFGRRAQNNEITPDEMQGGTFTISNGGVYGSLLSTPILNPPQSGILGMHNIVDRPMAVDGQVVIRPMMYLALSYDHRIIDGREAVTFLKRIKECVENPTRMLMEI